MRIDFLRHHGEGTGVGTAAHLRREMIAQPVKARLVACQRIGDGRAHHKLPVAG